MNVGFVQTALTARFLLAAVALLALGVAAVSSWNRRLRANNHHLRDDLAAETELLRQREELFRSLVASSSDVVTLVDDAGRIRYQSTAGNPIFGWELGRPPDVLIEELVHPDDRATLLAALEPAQLADGPVSIEVRLAGRDGSFSLTETTITNQLANRSVGGLVLSSRNITERKELEEQLRYRAFSDALTGLGNRSLFRDELERAVARVRRYHSSLAVCFIDLDGFKLVNDTLGHDAGDRLLIEVARRIRDTLRSSDVVARMGGDEFAVLLEQPEDVRSVTAVAGRILAALQTPVEIDGVLLRIRGSIGVDVTGGPTASTAEELLRNADLAMYRAKAQGKNQVQMYESRLRDAALSRVRLEKELRQAIDQRDLLLHYQPIVSLPSGLVTGVEALVRWNHPERGLVAPSEFIPVAEDSGLIVELGRWAVRQACMDIAPVTAGGFPIWVSVNVATRQLLQPGLVQAVRAAVAGSGLVAERLVLEITEGALLDDSRATASLLAQLQDQGVQLAIDDFGTGYSSLSRLRSFPVNKLKIDRSFIQEITHAHDRAPIVAAIVAMGHSLGLTAVAEGVETVEQLACLHQQGCEEIQGFLLSRPVPIDRLLDLLDTSNGVLTAPGWVPSDEAPESGFGRLVREAAAANSPTERMLPLLMELVRQPGVSGAYLAVVDAGKGVERILQAHAADRMRLGAGLEVPTANAGAFRVDDGDAVPAVLTQRGVTSVVSVPVLATDGPVGLVLALVSTEPAAIPSQTIALAELFTRLVGDIPTTGIRELSPAIST